MTIFTRFSRLPDSRAAQSVLQCMTPLHVLINPANVYSLGSNTVTRSRVG